MKRMNCLLLSVLVLFAMSLFGCSINENENSPHYASSTANSSWSKPVISTTSSVTKEESTPASSENQFPNESPQASLTELFDYTDVPLYSGSPYTEINMGTPFFTDEEKCTTVFETYSPLDYLGRCGVAYANICTELMPTDERGEIGMVQPAGWHTQRYDDLIEGKYLYNRCHLIGYQLAGENANVENLITGTRYLNVEGMLPLENQVAEYVQFTGHHVLYRVTPIYEGDNLLATGLLMEAFSVEDDGAGICFCNYVYNVQPYIDIDYANGNSSISVNAPSPMPAPTANTAQESEQEQDSSESEYIANTNTGKFHYPYCSSVDKMKEENKYFFTGTRNELINQEYVPCKRCNP